MVPRATRRPVQYAAGLGIPVTAGPFDVSQMGQIALRAEVRSAEGANYLGMAGGNAGYTTDFAPHPVAPPNPFGANVTGTLSIFG